MQVIKYMFQPHGDDRGQLVASREFKDIPFKISECTICMIQEKESVEDIMHIKT